MLERAGPSPRMALRDLPVPQVGPDQVLVKVQACGLCYHDVLVMRGVLRRGIKDQLVLGHEVSGVVAEVCADVTEFQPGDRVASIQTDACGICSRCISGREHRCWDGKGIGHSTDGGFAEYVRLRRASLVKLSPEIGLEGACLLGCPMGVGQRAITLVARVRPDERVLVTGAGGGLGAHAVQLAKAAGAQVLAVTTSEAKVGPIKSLGADEVICSAGLDYSEIVLAMTEDKGVDVVLDTVGSPTFDSAFRCLAQYGRLVLLGEVTGDQVALRLAEVIFRDASILGSSGASREDLRSALQLVSQGKVRPVVSGRFSLEQWQEAYQLALEHSRLGRLVLGPGE